MMGPEELRASCARLIERFGETITLRRLVPSAPPIEAEVRARVAGYQDKDVQYGIKQGARRLIVLAEDVESSGFPVPFKTNGSDKAIVRDGVLNIAAVDDSTRRVGGILIAYEITATG